MLKYNVKIDGNSKIRKMVLDDFYLSPDLSYISATTNASYDLSNNEIVKMKVPYSTDLVTAPISLETVIRQGYVMYPQKYKVHEIGNTKYILFNGIYHYEKDGSYTVNNGTYSEEDSYVEIPTKYYVDDSKVTINGETYEIEWNPSEKEENGVIKKYNDPLPIEINDKITLTVIEETWRKCCKIVINKESNQTLTLEGASCIDYVPYIIYANKKYYVEDDTVVINDNEYHKHDNADVIVVNDELFGILYEWKTVERSQYINLFLSQPIELYEGNIIIATSTDSVNRICQVIEDDNKPYIIYDGNKYFVQEKIVPCIKMSELKDFSESDYSGETYSNLEEFPILEDEYDLPYISVLGNRRYLEDYTDTLASFYGIYKTDGEKREYGLKTAFVKRYDGVVIDGDTFRVETVAKKSLSTNEEIEYKVVEVNKIQEYELKVDEVVGVNMIRCTLNTNIVNETDMVSECIGACTTVQNNFGSFVFQNHNNMFGDRDIVPIEGMEDGIIGSDTDIDLASYIEIYKVLDYVNIPIALDLEVANNVQQEIVLEDEFFNVEKENAINRIVDMERDIYYPAYGGTTSGNGPKQNFSLISELEFNLHFRTRDLESWKVIEDEGKESQNSGMCNWFITDYYKEDDFPNLGEEQRMMTSDLLQFLGFTDDDVFYQKSKIGKSFLRLSFYDSPDPKVQSLLHTSTLFMNEGKLYKNFINNVKNGHFLKIEYKEDDEGQNSGTTDNTEDEKIIKTSVSVDSEPYNVDDDKLDIEYYVTNAETEDEINTNDDINSKRLSCRFSVKNRYEEDTSAEGFYLYLFKEYSTNLRPRKIYLKVEFNHAGYGRTVPFMMPVTFDEDGNVEGIISIDDFKEGFPLDKIYRQMFIEMNVIYDADNQRYVYYLPEPIYEKMTRKSEDSIDKKMTFNLFEIKIKNEDEEDEQGN